ncbi:uncharacterized protein VTP21DRAFT_731 [Calcarisporiella thermophila]|uniref:uncharacterized protein n=1 Tax=Calcarisporiella thermophila TaxID=911321 RepID=UPI0037439F90
MTKSSSIVQPSTQNTTSEQAQLRQQTQLAVERSLREPTLDNAPKTTPSNLDETNRGDRSNYAELDDPALDSAGPGNDRRFSNNSQHATTVVTNNTPEAPSTGNRLEIIRSALQTQGFPEKAIELITKTERTTTGKHYASAWKKYITWCAKNGRDPCSYDLATATEYLAAMSETHHFTSLQVYKTGISRTWQILHPNRTPLADQQVIQRVIRGARDNTRHFKEKTPFWNVQKAIEKLTLIPSTIDTPLPRLGQKVALLLALTTIWRPRSDLARIPPSKVQFTRDDDNGLTGYDEFPTFFITTRRPPTPASGDTIARWITDILAEANILATAHSTRSTSSSHALQQRVPLDRILKAANWTSATIFEQFYHRVEMVNVPEGIPLRRNTIQRMQLGHDA